MFNLLSRIVFWIFQVLLNYKLPSLDLIQFKVWVLWLQHFVQTLVFRYFSHISCNWRFVFMLAKNTKVFLVLFEGIVERQIFFSCLYCVKLPEYLKMLSPFFLRFKVDVAGLRKWIICTIHCKTELIIFIFECILTLW